MNVLNCLPKLSQPKAKAAIRNIWQAETKVDAEKAFNLPIKIYEPKYPKATLCLQKDREELMAFFDFPAQHWQSIRTSNPIESAFATIRNRTNRPKGCLSRDGMLHILLATSLRDTLSGSGCSNWANAPRKTGGSYAALTSSPSHTRHHVQRWNRSHKPTPDRRMPNSPQTPDLTITPFTHDLHDLAVWFKSHGVTSVAMESTGIYWIPAYEILEQHGFEVILVNARYAKNVPGRKTDVCDASWLGQLHSYGLLRGSLRPSAQIATLRAYLRQRERLVQICGGSYPAHAESSDRDEPTAASCCI